MKPPPIGVALAVLLTVAMPAQDLPPWVVLLARVEQHGRATFEHIPDCTCRQTVSRSVKPLGSQSFTPVQPAALSSESLIVSGEISATPLNLFVHDAGRIRVSSEADLRDGTMFRFDFEVSALAGAYQVQSGGSKTMVGVRGTFWVDSQSLDLLRIEEHTVDLPPDFEARDVVRTTIYGRMRIGSSDVLLPGSSELIVTDSSGAQRRSLVEFSGCRESAGPTQPAQGPPLPDLLTRVKQHGRASFEHIPDYVCRQTVKRFEKPRNASAFKPAGGESLEVASGGERGSLLLAMVSRLCDPDEVVVADHGFPAAGASPALVRNIFVYGNAFITPSGEERVLGKPALRYEFEMTEALSGFTVRGREREVTSAVSGTFWVDAETLDPLRIEEHAEGFSWRLGIRDIAIAITYGRTRIGSSDALLPQSAETVFSDPRGGQKKTTLEFTGCREPGSGPK